MSKILVIDDSSFQRKSIVKLVTELGHTAFEAKNGALGIDQLSEQNFDCIMCDLLMPEMDGFEFLEKCKELKIKTPVLILTADKQDSSKKNVLELGAKLVLHKPPKEDELKIAFEEIFGGNNA